MATKATIYKALLNIANMDTNYYNEHNLTLALHPSETELRLMARVVAFILNASEDLVFCKGISDDDEPDLWEKDFDGSIKLWIELGQPDEKRIKKACGRSDKVIVYTYQENMAEPWFKQIENNINRFKNLSIIQRKRIYKRYVEGKSLQVIAKEENCTKQSVFKSISKALDKLRIILEKNGYDVTD